MTNASASMELQIVAKDMASKVIDDLNKKTGGWGKTLQDVSKIASGFLAAGAVSTAASKITGFIGDSLSAASDLQQAVGGVQSIFKESADEVLGWGNQNASSFGLSKRAFAEMAGPLGAMLKNAGFDMETVTGKTVDLTKRAADMAATFGGSVEDALGAVTAALRGETDPIERYGVSVSAAKVEMQALAETGKKTASELTDQEKATARLNLIMMQTADAAGQFARESKTAAGSAEIQKAKLEDLQAQIGTKLLPVQIAYQKVQIAAIDFVVTKVIPVLESLYAKHWPAIAAAVQTYIGIAKKEWELLQPVIEFVVKDIVTKIGAMMDGFRAVAEIVTSTVELVKAIFRGDWATAWQEMKDIAGAAVDALQAQVKIVFGSLPQLLLDLVGEAADAGLALGKAMANGVIRGINSLLASLSGRTLIPGISAPVIGQVTPDVKIPGLGQIPLLEKGHPFIPFDNFPALLHKGERVLTAAENRAGATSNVTLDLRGATFYNMDDFERQVGAAFVNLRRRGALYGFAS